MNSQKQKRFSGFKKAISVTVMGAVCLTAACSVAALSKTVTVTDGDKTMTINTLNSDTDLILERTGVSLGANDKLVRTDGDDNNINISILRAFNVDVVDGNTTKTLTFNEGTVADALKAAGLTLSGNDTVSLSATTTLEPDMEIKISRWYTVELDVRGKKMTKEVPAGTVEEALKYLDIKLTKNDKMNVAAADQVKDGLKIQIQKITYKNVTKTEKIDFKVTEKKSDDMYEDETSVEREGVEGERTIVSKEKYVNDKLVSTTEVSNKETKKAVDKIVVKGTKEREQYQSQVFANNDSVSVGGNTININGQEVRYTNVLNGSGTAYYAPAGASTATGRLARYGVVAVNPYIIPYGSILYIVSDDGEVVYGYAVAGDTGGALMDGSAIVDLYYNTYDECCQFGRRNVTIYVLDGVSEDATY